MILLTGGTGTAGSEISKALQRMGVRYRSLVRNRAKAAGSASTSVELVEGDLSRPETLGAALEGVEKALLLTASSPDSLQQERNFIHAAKRAGVRHFVKFSAYGAGLDAPHYFGRQHGEAERELEDSGLPFTMLRPNGFFQNFLGNATSIQTRSALHAPAGEMKFSAVDVRDIAAVAAHVLTEDGHQWQRYTITGPAGALACRDRGEALSSARAQHRVRRCAGGCGAGVDVGRGHTGLDRGQSSGLIPVLPKRRGGGGHLHSRARGPQSADCVRAVRARLCVGVCGCLTARGLTHGAARSAGRCARRAGRAAGPRLPPPPPAGA